MDLVKRMGLASHCRFIEFGCGPLTLGLPLIGYLDAGKYIGIDVRSEVLNRSWEQIGKTGLAEKNAPLLISNSFGAEELNDEACADMMWSFSVLYHLTDELVDRCFAQVARRLSVDGAYFANINPTQTESTWLEFPFNRREVDFYRSKAERHGLRVAELGTLQSLGFKLDTIEKVNVMLKVQRA